MKAAYFSIKDGKKIIYIFLLLMTFASIMLIWFNIMLSPPNAANEAFVQFEVSSGITAKQLAVQMKDKGIIKDPLAFRLYAKLNGLDVKIKSGNYLLSPSMTLKQILDKLVTGETINNDIKITIPEGSNLETIASIFQKRGLVSKDDFIGSANVNKFKIKYSFLEEFPEDTSLEGFLFPDTYFLPKGKKPEFYIDVLLNMFEKTYFSKVDKLLKENGIEYTPYQIVTIASIIEAEAKLDSERPIIAGVFYNRLRIGKPLESCATIAYIIDEHKEILTFEDLEVDSPYNTYKNIGLPPGPIGSAGLSSLMAAANPAEVDYLYFVAKGDGSHVFSKTYAEHSEAQNSIQKVK